MLRLLAQLCEEMGSSLVFVTHDLAVVSQTCSRMSVMYAGRLMEQGSVRGVYEAPRHPYTEALFDSAPDFDDPQRELVAIPGLPPSLTDPPPGCPFAPRCAHSVEDCDAGPKPLVGVGPGRLSACDRADAIYGARTMTTTGSRPRCCGVEGVSKHYGQRRTVLRALDGVDLALHRGEILGLVGESGSGKSTLAKILSGGTRPDVRTRCLVDGVEMEARRGRDLRRRIQMVFQDPYSSLNPRMTVRADPHRAAAACTRSCPGVRCRPSWRG